MSFYPQGMATYNNVLNNGQPKTWKGTGFFSNPIGVTWGNIRPLTNKDATNNDLYKSGASRPIKQYRKGISIVSQPINLSREVRSSTGNSLVSQLIDLPGCFNAIQNTDQKNNIEYMDKMCSTFHGIGMVNSVYPTVNYYEKPPVIMQSGDSPIFIDLNNKQMQAHGFCCSQPKNALRLLRTSTNLKQNYYTNNYQYLQNRCQTYDQRIFNFATPRDFNSTTNSETNYVANCLPNFIIQEGMELEIIDVISRKLIEYNIEFQPIILLLKKEKTLADFLNGLYLSLDKFNNKEEIAKYINEIVNINSQYLQNYTNRKCSKVIYKPNNAQFATQGAVTASTYILKKDVVTLEKNAAIQNKQNIYEELNGPPSILKTKSLVQSRDCMTYGNRPSKFSYLYPPLYNRKYTPSIVHHKGKGEFGITV